MARLTPRARGSARTMPNNTRWTKAGLGALVHAAGWSLEQLAERTGYTVTQLRFVFVWRRSPTVELLLRLQDLLGLDGDTLLRACRAQVQARLTNSAAAR